MAHGGPATLRAQKFPFTISFNAAFSSSASASNRLRVEFYPFLGHPDSHSNRTNQSGPGHAHLAAYTGIAPTSRAHYDRNRTEGKKHNAALICLADDAATSPMPCSATVPTTTTPDRRPRRGLTTTGNKPHRTAGR